MASTSVTTSSLNRSYLLICTSFVFRTRGIVCVVYQLFRLANLKGLVKGACSSFATRKQNFRDTLISRIKKGTIKVGKFLKKLRCCVGGSITR